MPEKKKAAAPKRTRANGIFVNLPVRDLQKSIDFFGRLGFEFDPRFTDETATCMIIGERMYAMIMTHEKFAEFAPGPVSDARQASEVLVSLEVENRARVDELVREAVAAGGTTYRNAYDYGFMYGQAFQDLDGHTWEAFQFDMAAYEKSRREA